MISSMKEVSRYVISVLMNAISFFIFSQMSRGSSYGQRRMAGAVTMDRSSMDIFVCRTDSAVVNICEKEN